MPTINQEMPLHILLVTLEFTYSPFSGNGILARSLVKSLLQEGCHVTVWCCRPERQQASDHHLCPPEITTDQANRLNIIATTIPERLGWHRVDKGSPWEYFAWSNLDESDEVRLLTAASNANVVCPIDWTGCIAWQSVACHFTNTLPVLYLNFRVFSSGFADPDERDWYTEKEKEALDQASFVVALSEKDKQSLCELLNDSCHIPVKVLLPPLRGDVKELALLESNDLQQHLPENVSLALANHPSRCLVTCVARLSREKHVENFVKFVEANRALLQKNKWIPLLAGSNGDEEYATRIKESLKKVSPNSIIVDSFLSPKALCAVFSRAVLNIHPCEYDAFGMTLCEAAAMSVPSLMEGNGHIGASAIVGNGASIEVEMSKGNYCWESVTEILNNEQLLRGVGEEAKRRALAWDEAAYGKQLLGYLQIVATRHG